MEVREEKEGAWPACFIHDSVPNHPLTHTKYHTHRTQTQQPDAELSSRALWARWLLLPHPDASNSSVTASIATLVLLLAVSGLPAAR